MVLKNKKFLKNKSSKTLINKNYLVDDGDYYTYGEHWWKESQPLFYYG